MSGVNTIGGILGHHRLVFYMTTQFSPVTSGARLSDQVAQQLSTEIRSGRLAPSSRLPAEGSGVFVVASVPFVPLNFDARHADSKEAVVQMVEVRRALEAEVAALAAQRRSEADVKRIKKAVLTLDKAVRDGGDGVEEDVQFHRAIADAACNPFLISTLQYLSQFLRGATQVTRANEARRADFASQVRAEHAAIVAAIEAGDTTKARAAAARHMNNAIRRIGKADASFWRQEGDRLAQPLVSGLPDTPASP